MPSSAAGEHEHEQESTERHLGKSLSCGNNYFHDLKVNVIYGWNISKHIQNKVNEKTNDIIHTVLQIPTISNIIKSKLKKFHSNLSILPNPTVQVLSSPNHSFH
jgi:hypothetical protein